MDGSWLSDEIVSIELSKRAFRCLLMRTFGNIDRKDAEISLEARIFLEALYEEKEKLDWTTRTRRTNWGIVRITFGEEKTYIMEIIEQWGKSDKELFFTTDTLKEQYEKFVPKQEQS